MRAHDPRPGERLLLRTRNSDPRWWALPFQESFVGLSQQAATFLAERRRTETAVDWNN